MRGPHQTSQCGNIHYQLLGPPLMIYAAGTALERVLRSAALVRLSPLAKDPLIAKDRPAEAPHLEVEAGMAHTRLYTMRATLEMERAVQDMAERLSQAPGPPWRSSGSMRPPVIHSFDDVRVWHLL